MRPQILSAFGIFLLASAGTAQVPPLIDYANASDVAPPGIDAAEVTEVLDLLGSMEPEYRAKLGADAKLLGHVRGSFTSPGAEQRAWLFSDKGPTIAQPGLETDLPLLLITDPSDGLVGLVSLPLPYSGLRGAVDTDADGIDGLLLERGFTNMGIVELWLDAVNVTGGSVIVASSWRALNDTCGQQLAPRAIEASRFLETDEGLQVETTTLPCPTETSQ